MSASGRHILFYDGECCFCNSIVQFALRHDKRGLWRYSPLQSQFAARALGRYGVDPSDLDQIHALENYIAPDSGTGAIAGDPQLPRLRSGLDAGVLLWRTLSGWPRIFGALLALTPRFIREPAYRQIARHRYRLFGKYDECRLPSTGQRELFILDSAEATALPQAGEAAPLEEAERA